jgi:protoporphyrinogen/coproporphyrinogen III oxidase
MTRIAVVGAGISGLSTAYALQRLAGEAGLEVDIVIVEKKDRIGGKIWSIREEGYLCEWGPNGFLDNKPMTLELCDQVGMRDHIVRSNDNARKRYIYSEGKLHQLPENGPSFLKSDLISWSGKFRLAYEAFIPPRLDADDETLADFARRRLGQEALDKLIAPMVSGIFAGDPETMSLKSCFPRIHQLEQEYGGLLKAMVKLAKKKRAEVREGKVVASAAGPGGVLTSFHRGIQELTDGVAESLHCILRIGAEVTKITSRDGGFELHLAEGGTIDAEMVVSASPAHALADMIAPVDGTMAQILNEIRYASMNVICFGYQREKIGHSLDGFGYLIPRKENRSILGTLWDSSIFPQRVPEGCVLLRSMMGGATNPGAVGLPDSTVKAHVMADLRDIMGITAEPDFVRIFRHEKAIPQYTLGHGRRLQALDERLSNYPGLFLTGNAFSGVGLNDCVHASNQTAGRVVEFLQTRAG